jgi:hypothetical protein
MRTGRSKCCNLWLVEPLILKITTMRKIDIFLIAIVAIYLCLVLPIFNKEHVMEFGNFSDILSALSTFGTLCIAYIAFRKAPEWLHQKKNEDGYLLAKELILDDYLNMYKKFRESTEKLREIQITLEYSPDKISKAINTSECIKHIHSLKNNSMMFVDLNHKISKLSKFGYNLKKEVLHYNNEFRSMYSELYTSNSTCWLVLKSYIEVEVTYHIDIEQKENIISHVAKTINLDLKIVKKLQEFDNFCDDVLGYFDIKNNNI